MERGRQGGAGEPSAPLSPIDFSVLLVLAERELYGYAIVKAVAERSAGSLRLASGNLYQVLDRLLSRGWIAELEPREAPDADGRRRYYELTELGRTVLAAEASRLRSVVSTAARLGVLDAVEGAGG